MTEPSQRVKPVAASDVSTCINLCKYFAIFCFVALSFDNISILVISTLWQIMWAEAMGKLECMDSADRERLWPQLVQGFKDLSHRLKV